MNAKALEVLQYLKKSNKVMCCAESCTGGMISAAITDIPGSSAVFDRGFVTYSNNAKIDLLGVREETLKDFGAVSTQVAEEMARGAYLNALSDIAVSVTGVAGPDGGSAEKPVGFVCFGVATKEKTISLQKNFEGSRQDIRSQSVDFALQLVLENI